MNIPEHFQTLKNSKSDINEHLQTLKDLASTVESVVEFGSRFGESTTAFTTALIQSNTLKKVTSYDLKKQDSISIFEEVHNYKFYETDTLKCEIEETDLLFIDTLHRYYQLYNELIKHSKKVKKYIIMHDTTTYGTIDEPFYPSNIVKMSETITPTQKQGLINAIKDFLDSEDGKNWKEYAVYNNNNGLTILERKSY